MQLNQFTGGLSTRIDEALISASAAVICNNVDMSSVVLKSAKDLTSLGTAMLPYFYKFKDVFYSSENYRNYLAYRDSLYYTEPATKPQKIHGGIQTDIGIAAPEAVPAFDTNGNPIFDQAGEQYKGIVPIVSDFNLASISYAFGTNTNGDLPAATYNYRFGVVQNGVVTKYTDASFTSSSTGAITITFQPLGGLTLNVYRQYSGVYYYIGQVLLSDTKVVSDTVLNISSNSTYYTISDLGYVFSTVAGGNLTAATYNYRFAITYNSKVFDYVDASYTIASTTSIKLTFESLGGARIFIYRQHSGTYRYIGAVTLSADNTTFTDSILDISSNTAFTQTGITYGIIQYTMTYYNDNTGIESAPMAFSSELTVQLGKQVQVTRLPIATDTQVTHRRVYRLGGNLVSMSLIKEFNDNTTTSFYDYTDDINTTTVLESYEYLQPPVGIKYLVEAYGTLFAADGKDLVFSLQGFPEYWPASNRINFDAIITGILPTPNGILVSTEFKTWILVGSSVADFAKYIVTEEQGCICHESFRMVKNMPVWVSYDGICSLSNGLVSVISKDLLGTKHFDIKTAIVYSEQYILVLNDGSLFVFDTRFTPNFCTFTLSSSIVGIGVFNNILYGVTEARTLCSLFTGTPLQLTYKTGKLIDENYSMLKAYNNVYVRSNGDFEVELIVDDVSAELHTITGNGIFDLTVPAELQRGSSIQFNIQGVGTIYEIEYKQLGRQNGR